MATPSYIWIGFFYAKEKDGGIEKGNTGKKEEKIADKKGSRK